MFVWPVGPLVLSCHEERSEGYRVAMDGKARVAPLSHGRSGICFSNL